jgi:hypothetical protein
MRTLLFVLGASRSGTSLLTRLLSMSGGALPRTLLGPRVGNPTGHWEPQVALQINNRFLAACDSSWLDPSLRLQVGTPPPAKRTRKLADDIRAFFERELQTGDVVLIKEPRLPFVLDHWLSAASQSGLACKAIHIHRHPEEAAASLHARDSVARDHAYLLWVKSNLLAERYTRGYARDFISYERLLGDWKGTLEHCIETLDLKMVVPSSQAVAGFLSADLRHHRSEPDVSADPTPGHWARRLYALLEDACANDVDRRAMDAIFDEYEVWDRPYRRSGVRRLPQWEAWMMRVPRFAARRPRPERWRHPRLADRPL